MQKLKVLELPIGVSIKVHENGDIESIDHIRKIKNGRLDNRKGKEVMPNE